jgi:hypothetical protein
VPEPVPVPGALSPDTGAGDPRWREAAVLGSLWAAAEIVLGSFLHNLKVPLRGHIMTAIGVILLVAGHRRWPQRGLIWRAGLIAAAMKSASPSAVLLGPMLAIAMEGFAMEVASRLFPRRLVGYLIGGALAMSWTMTHRLLAWLMTYGGNLLTVYEQLVAFAERQLGHVPLGAWGPIVALAAVNVAAGFAAAAAGWSVAAAPPLPAGEPAPAVVPRHGGNARASGPAPSLVALASVVVALPLGMFALGKLPLAGAAAVVAAAALLAWVRYPLALRRLRRPSFWIGLALLTALAGVVFLAEGTADGPPWNGFLIGVAMSLRAVFIALCFAVLGTELTNPRIREWMARRGAAPFLAALETAFAALPETIAALPPARILLRHPRRAVGSLLPHLERWLTQARQQPS